MTKSKKSNTLAEAFGWYGTSAILIAYALVSFEVIAANGILFQLLNLTGAIGIIIISLHKNVKQSVVLNIFWIAVAVITITRLFFV